MKKRFTDEQIFGILREAEVGAMSIKALCKKHNLTENARLKRLVAEQMLVKALRYLGLSRRIASYAPRQAAKDQAVAERLLAASPNVPRFGYRRMAAWLDLGEARVRRLWRQLGLNIPRRRPRRRRSGNDIRLPGAVRRDRPRGLAGRGRLQRVTAAYEQQRRERVLPSTWEVITVQAWGPAPGAPRREQGVDLAAFPAGSIPIRRR